MKTVYLGLGSNLGDREKNLGRALERLAEKVTVERVSSLYETEPVGYREQSLFLNAVCQCRTHLTAGELFDFVKGIEGDMGREPSFPNGPRLIDIDILFYGDADMEGPELVIPHPRLAQRAFVLIPLAEIAPDLVHPVRGRTAAEMAQAVEGREGVRRWEGKRAGVVQR